MRGIRFVAGAALALAIAGIAAPASGQSTFPTAAPGVRVGGAVILKCDAGANGPTNCRPPTSADPLPTNGTVQPTTITGTDASGTIAQANVAQVIQAANAARRGCLIQNTSAGTTETLVVGSTTIVLASGATFNCALGSTVAGDAIAIRSATAGAAYSAYFQ